jgi:hypothetical protein
MIDEGGSDLEVAKRTSLLRYKMDHDRKNFYSTGHALAIKPYMVISIM